MGDGEGNEPKKKFKVVDRRRFDMEGEVREGAELKQEPAPRAPASPPPEPAAPPAESRSAAPPAPAQPAPSTPSPAGGAEEEEEPPIPFAAVMQSMAQQCLMQLGMLPFPSGTRQLDLEGARDTVDILTTLRIKTRGNLTDEEDRAFEQILYELRMTYLEIANKVAQAGPGGPGGPPTAGQ